MQDNSISTRIEKIIIFSESYCFRKMHWYFGIYCPFKCIEDYLRISFIPLTHSNSVCVYVYESACFLQKYPALDINLHFNNTC